MTSIPVRQAVANIYNPQNQTKEQLIEGFVVRQQLFKKLFKTIKEAKMEVPEQHYLLLGRRGMGKTTLLLRLAYEIEKDPKLNDWLIPLVFNEEEYGIRSLFKLWERVMELLEEKHPDFRFEADALKQISRQHATDHDAYERALFEWLSSELKRHGKKLILFMDNFGDMARKLSDAEAHRLRKILQTNADIRIFAASSVVLEAFYKYDHPFYEFFKTEELKGLNEEETRELLLSLSKHFKKDSVQRIIEESPGRVEALRRITGGVIRTIVLLYEIFSDDEDGSAFHDLQVILDRGVTNLYKHRMDDLSDQQQAIVEAIALNWDAISVKEIVEQTRLESKVVSAQLSALEKNGIIEKRATRTKNHLYLISERFFNIWFLMRLGRKTDQKRVLWLVRFFEEWCDKDLLKHRAEQHLDAIRKGGFYAESAYYITQALASTKDIDLVSRHKLLTESKAYLAGLDLELAQSLSPSDLEIAVEAIKKWYRGNKDESIQLLRPARPFSQSKIGALIKDINTIPSFKRMEETKIRSWEEAMGDFACDIGWLFYHDLQKKEIGWQCLELSANSKFPRAMNRLGRLYQNEYHDIEKAEEWYLKAAEKGHAGAMRRLGRLYQDEFENITKAEEWYLKAVGKGNVNAMWLLGSLYQIENKDIEKAEEWYLKAAEKGNSGAMWLLGWLYQNEYKNYIKAEKWYLLAAKKGNEMAMRNLGWLYQNEYKDMMKAENWYCKAAEKGNTDAMWYLARLFQNEHNDMAQAENWYYKAAEKGDSDSMISLGRLYQYEYNNLIKAEEWYLRAAENGESIAMNTLGRLYQNQIKDLSKAEGWYQKAAGNGDSVAMYNLGWLYKNVHGDINKAEECFLNAANLGNLRGLNSLAWCHFEQKKEKDKTLELITKAYHKEIGNSDFAHTYACILLWHNQVEMAFDVSASFVWDKKLQQDDNDDFLIFFAFLLAKNQEQWLYQLFISPKGQQEGFKDRFKPIWYATLKKLDHPDFLRMGDELSQTVEEVLEKAAQMAEDYK